MTTTQPYLQFDAPRFRVAFDREPIPFSHNLSDLDLFKIESLHALAEKMADTPCDYMVAGGAPQPGTEFFAVPAVAQKPHEVIESLGSGSYRVLLKRAENYDQRYKDLVQTLFNQVMEARGGLNGEKIERLESGILISSAATITPFHFDPEIGFFSQIEGEKSYHVYSPTVVTEPELESFYVRGAVSIAQVDLETRDRSREYVFSLKPGMGFHQPQNSPHWVETGNSRSISFTFVFETDATRAMGRTRSFNHYLRRLHWKPAVPGLNPAIDNVKADAMKVIVPVRKSIGRVVGR
ncbi:MAG TPA: hypothetical protein VH351_19840 [Bryobacteraceae bacterium]|jgi:hypothetical protein|nr:hypothetical protein [Bryobacteraceae bacterium]